MFQVSMELKIEFVDIITQNFLQKIIRVNLPFQLLQPYAKSKKSSVY